MAEERPDLPYEKAIEETAKSVGKAIDVIDRASPAIGDVYGWLIGDRLAEARARNADKFARKTKKIIEQRNLDQPLPIPEQIAEPLLEAAQAESRDDLQELYAALSANAMDPNYCNDVRPEFIQTVKSLQPFDLIVLKEALEFRSRPSTSVFQPHQMFEALKGFRSSSIELSLDNLKRQNCLREHSQGLVLSSYGQEFLIACNPHATQ